MRERVVDFIVRTLGTAGVRHVFGVGGANIEDLYDAIFHADIPVRAVVAKHEFSAATMADGHSRGREGSGGGERRAGHRRHPYYDANPRPELASRPDRPWVGDFWDMFYAGHTVELNNLKAILEHRHRRRLPIAGRPPSGRRHERDGRGEPHRRGRLPAGKPGRPNRHFLRNWHTTLRLPPARHPDTFEEYGNLFAAAIPITLDHAIRTGTLHDDSLLVLAGFAHAGDFTGAAAIHWHPATEGL